MVEKTNAIPANNAKPYPFDHGLRSFHLPEGYRWWGDTSEELLELRHTARSVAEARGGFLVVAADIWNVACRIRAAKTAEHAAFLLDQYVAALAETKP